MAQQHRFLRNTIALLTVLTLLVALFPLVPAQTYAASNPISVSKTQLVVGYPSTTITVTGSDSYKLKSDTRVLLYDANGIAKDVVRNVNIQSNNTMTFTLQPGLSEGRYMLFVQSYAIARADINILTSFDPTNIKVTPGVERDIRLSWTDPNSPEVSDIFIQYGLKGKQNSWRSISVPLGEGGVTIPDLEHEKYYAFKIYARKSGLPYTMFDLDNGGEGYQAVDKTPPNDVTNIDVTAVNNGFNVKWKDPVDDAGQTQSDLNNITVQYAEHGTTDWSDGFVVSKGVQKVTMSPMNTAKRYDLRFTKTDTYGNWSYQIDTHNGYGYTFDTRSPNEVSSFGINTQSDSSAYITWYDPNADSNPDFHHITLYLRTELNEYKSVGRINKGVQSYTLSGLAPNIPYTLKAVTVDSYGNESSGVTRDFKINPSSTTFLTDVEISQEASGGLQMKWDSESASTIDFDAFKIYYAPIGTAKDKDYKETVISNKAAKSASLRDMPTGTYFLQMRLFDSHGMEYTLKTFTNYDSDLRRDAGYYVSGTGNGLPTEVSKVRIQPDSDNEMLITWNASTTDGSHLELYYAERSDSPYWKYVTKVDKRQQRYSVTGLDQDKDYFFKIVVVDDAKSVKSRGKIYDNSGYGYNLLNGDRYAPHEVTNANASLSLNTLSVSYNEPSDPDFDKVNIYVSRVGSTEQPAVVSVPAGSNGTTLRELIGGASYTLRITTVDIFGNESEGVKLTNNGVGYTISGTSSQSVNEVRNALLIPDTNKLTVRWLDPLAADFKKVIVGIKKRTETSFSNLQTISAGTNEATFYNLSSNQQYQVRIVTVNNSNKESAGIILGGDTGISLLPISNVTDPRVTPGSNRLTVSWQASGQAAAGTVQVEVQENGSVRWHDPVIVNAATGRAVINGLVNGKSYNVRLTTVQNSVASASKEFSDYAPTNAFIVPNISQLQQASGSTKTIELLGTNTRFYSNENNAVKLYNESNLEVSSYLSNLKLVTSDRMSVTVNTSMPLGRYKLVLLTPKNGELSTTFDIVSPAAATTLIRISQPTADYGRSLSSMQLVGTGFTRNSTVSIDGGNPISVNYSDSQHLSFNVPSGLLPGPHKITVNTGGQTTAPQTLNIYAFRGSADLTFPNMRSGSYKAELSVSNLDRNPRSAKVLVVIRRNGLFMESKELSHSFSGGETKKFRVDFGGTNTPYADGPTKNITVQAYVVDPSNSTPLSDPFMDSQSDYF